MDDNASQVGEGRVRPLYGMNEGVDMEIEDMDPRNLENELVAADGLDEVMELAPAMLTVRATKMFTEGEGAPRMSKERAFATEPTLWMAKLAKEAVWELFDHRAADVKASWGEPLDREEAVGYLACDALGVELVPGEARVIGKKAVKAIKATKEQEDKVKSRARANKAKARKAAATNDESALLRYRPGWQSSTPPA